MFGPLGHVLANSQISIVAQDIWQALFRPETTTEEVQ